MTSYKHTQIGYLVLVAMVCVAVLYGWLLVVMQAEEEFNGFAVTVIAFVMFMLASFASLTVTIDEQYLRIKFGYGIFLKSFPLGEISSVKTVKNHWYYGRGIRLWFWPRMTIFNVSGFDAVEITMKNGKLLDTQRWGALFSIH